MKTKAGYSLGFLFLVMAVVAVMFTMLRFAMAAIVSSDAGWSQFLTSSVVTGLCTAVIGGIMGLYHDPPPLGATVGAGIGFWIGCIVGPLLFVQVENAGALFLVQAGGAVLLVLITMLLSRPRPHSDVE